MWSALALVAMVSLLVYRRARWTGWGGATFGALAGLVIALLGNGSQWAIAGAVGMVIAFFVFLPVGFIIVALFGSAFALLTSGLEWAIVGKGIVVGILSGLGARLLNELGDLLRAKL